MSEEQNNKQEEQKIKRGKNFDVFISYRRSDGTVKAKALDLAFSMDDCRTFLDFKSLGTGAFDKRLENAVLDAPIFIMVWTPDYFKRCVKEGEKTKNEDDWVRKEIELALANGKKIIPINYDEGMDKVPDYLDEELKTKLGVHNVVNLHGDNTFDDTVKGILDREIRPFIGAAPKPENKVNVRVKADADCELIDNDEVIATIQQGKTAQLFFERGEYELIARSTAFPKIYEVIEKNFDDVSYHYLVNIKLAKRVLGYRDKIINPRIARCWVSKLEERREEEHLRREEEEERLAEERKKEEEQRRKEEQARLEAERQRQEYLRKEEQARKLLEQERERQRREAEERRRAEEERKAAEKARREAEQNRLPEIYSIEIGNVTYDGDVITDYGDNIYSSETMYLAAQINCKSYEDREYKFDVKWINPDGSIRMGDSSPTGYTCSESYYLSYGERTEEIAGWGGKTKGWWEAGNYAIEIWCEGTLLKRKEFTIY